MNRRRSEGTPFKITNLVIHFGVFVFNSADNFRPTVDAAGSSLGGPLPDMPD
jgi:hypothetical protein